MSLKALSINIQSLCLTISIVFSEFSPTSFCNSTHFAASFLSLCQVFAILFSLLKASQLDRTRRASERARRSFLRRAPKHPKLRSCNFAVARSLCGRRACQATLLEFSQGKLHRVDSQTHRGTRTRDPLHNSQGCGG